MSLLDKCQVWHKGELGFTIELYKPFCEKWGEWMQGRKHSCKATKKMAVMGLLKVARKLTETCQRLYQELCASKQLLVDSNEESEQHIRNLENQICQLNKHSRRDANKICKFKSYLKEVEGDIDSLIANCDSWRGKVEDIRVASSVLKEEAEKPTTDHTWCEKKIRSLEYQVKVLRGSKLLTNVRVMPDNCDLGKEYSDSDSVSGQDSGDSDLASNKTQKADSLKQERAALMVPIHGKETLGQWQIMDKRGCCFHLAQMTHLLWESTLGH